MYYSYVEIEYVATSFSPARMDSALKLLSAHLACALLTHFASQVRTYDFATCALPK
jgi:hypothetical protein